MGSSERSIDALDPELVTAVCLGSAEGSTGANGLVGALECGDQLQECGDRSSTAKARLTQACETMVSSGEDVRDLLRVIFSIIASEISSIADGAAL